MVRTFSRARDGNTRLAPNFTVWEFRSRCGADEILIDERLPRVLQSIRDLLGNRPLSVTSGYRTPEHNARSGGASNSHHIHGRAADIQQHGTDLILMCRAAETAFIQHGISGGICIYPNRNFVHVDLRSPPRWRGQDDSDGRGARNVSGWQPLNNDSANTTNVPAQSSTENDSTIWHILRNQGLDNFGVAGMMGNLFAESGYRSNALERTHHQRLGMNDETYTAAVDNGSYTREQFIRDRAGYGLSQWTFHSRKAGLYDLAKSRNVSVGNIHMQLAYLMLELHGEFRTVLTGLKNPSGIRQASDLVLTRFMRPADMGESVQVRRFGYGLAAFNKFTNAPSFEQYQIRVDVNGLNVRTAPGTNNPVVRNNNEPVVIRNRGTFTILEEADGLGASKWGRINSGEFVGWISLDHIIRL